MHPSGCPSREQIAAYLMGTLPGDEAGRLGHHLKDCPACRSIVEELKGSADELIDRLRQPAPADPPHPKPQPGEALTEASDPPAGPPNDTGASCEETKTGSAELGRLGEYKLQEELGHGGMGTVYRALHVRLGKQVALKVLPSGRTTDRQAVARFEREMKAVGRLDHPNIVRATDAGEAQGTQFLVMEFIEGFNLSELVDRCGRLPAADACELIRQAALGLQCAHEHGLVHRDVKPSNLMLTGDGQVKLLDLGLARFQVDQPGGDEMTATGQPMGTADYMAPEQVSDTHSVDVRADLYSLGCTFYKLLAGQAPFGGPEFKSSFDKMMAHRQRPAPPIGRFRPDLPGELVAVLERMLMKEPDRRFATPAEVVDALGPLAAGCDLPGLMAHAKAGPEESTQSLVPPTPADHLATAPFSATQPGRNHAAKPAGIPSLRRWKPWASSLGLILVILALAWLYRMATQHPDTNHGPTEVVLHEPGESPIDQPGPPQVPPEQPPQQPSQQPPPEQPPPEQPSQQPTEQPPPEQPPQQPPEQPPPEQPPQQPPPEQPPQQPPTEQPPPDQPPQQPTEQPPPKQPPQQPTEQPPPEQPPQQPTEQPPPEQPPEQPPPEQPPQQPPEQPPPEQPPQQQPTEQPPPEQPPQQPPEQLPPEPPPQQPPEQPPPEQPPQQPPEQPPQQPPEQLPPEQPPEIEKPAPAPKLLVGQIQAEPLRILPGAPLGRSAMVARPAPIEGVRSWTIETRAHRGPVYQAAYRRDGQVLATAGGDGAIRLWAPHSGTLLRVLLGHDGPVNSLSWAPDGSALASAGDDHTIRLWDLETGLLLRTLRGSLGKVHSVAWSPGGQTLASAGSDTLVRLWDIAGGKIRQSLPGHQGDVYCVTFSPDGTLLASGGQDKTVRVWDAASGELRHALADHEGHVHGVAFSPDGETLAAVAETPQVGGAVELWEVATGKRRRTLPEHRHGDRCLAWSSGAELLAAGGAVFDGSVRVWGVRGGNLLYSRGKPSGIQPAFAVAFSPDGMVLAAGGNRGRVQLWDALSGDSVGMLPAHAAWVARTAFSPDETRLACGYHDGSVRIWETGSGEPVRQFDPDLGAVQRLAWSPDGKRLAAAYFSSGLVDVWDLESGEHVAQLEGVKDRIEGIAWSPDAKSIAIGGVQAQRWEVESGQLSANLPGQGNVLVYSPDGSTMAVGMGGDVKLVEPGSGRLRRTLHGPNARLCAAAFSPDGTLLAAGCDDSKVYVWDVESGRVQANRSDFQAPVGSLVWLEDGTALFCGNRSEVCVWQPRSNKLVERFTIDGGAFSPAARLVASRGASMVRLMHLGEDGPLRSIVALADRAHLVLSPDGHWCGSAGVEEEILYVVQTGAGQETLAPAEFAEKYRWQNNPKRVGLGSQ